jgi:hypothetical protein
MSYQTYLSRRSRWRTWMIISIIALTVVIMLGETGVL